MLQSQGSGYEIQSRDFSAHIGIKIYPYRTGSKIIIQAKISNMKPVANLINVSNNIKELEKSINDIVNN